MSNEESDILYVIFNKYDVKLAAGLTEDHAWHVLCGPFLADNKDVKMEYVKRGCVCRKVRVVEVGQ